jgi:hypothetical protein
MNWKKLPKQEDVEQIDSVRIVEITDDNRKYLLEMALSMYANEPCRICGKLITLEDVHENAVFAGYSIDNKSRSAHKTCWENQPPKKLWAFQDGEEK